ncbi:MAG: dihydrolipoamide acetyltransferase family protein [Gemmatimonadota bacterium]|nr:dihydrolipoamide acetyltransferase family protein [Gemmatimonadota bacterium]MDE3006398.1 dihydrolipoamide acetyltransferase family protein [Gemmatimonadota bacterium]MDE3013463.1 dihydrolipoamide acetyltransferase family protein [Gemmatimonadota bacterium]
MARIEVPMPQMGESIAEGTVSQWLKQVGDAVERDEPILEISTDKVDAEIPSPSDGTLVEIAVQEGETVEVGTIVAFIDTEAGATTTAPAAAPAPAPEPAAGTEQAAPPPVAAPVAPVAAAVPPPASDGPQSAEERLRTRSTPVVRKIAEEHGVDIQAVPGTGHAGRVTKQDILDFIEQGGAPAAPAVPAAATPAPAAAPAPSAAPSDLWTTFYREVQHPEFPVRSADTVEPMDKIRRLTAEHMVVAKRVAPHVHSFIEIDFSAIDGIRAASKERWAAQGARVSYTAFVAWAVSRVLREFPMVNSTVSGNNVIYRGNVNLGMAVDLNPGLIVPVVRDADHLGLVGIGNKIVDLATRARDRKLMPDEIQGATFTITNPGVLGTLVGLPVIPKGTAAILGTGAIEKKVVVVTDPNTGTDSMAIRKKSLFSLGYDHRIVDGADAARFLSRLKETLETFPHDA